ncbi:MULTISPECIES: FxsA family protein [Rhizobium]|uniref:Membrane protein FxsA n=1 Tax=Rhizobium rhododendri TaxID=2506430 RepID=A0ABY8IHG0_9HYPH|nr:MULTISPECIES: FxsA family protein [Rhizobium]MBO9100409.1 membrane protein FxsA [Rhizobium sp. L58/93]MBO9135451.1 membrane protein FxsA [Rhizobium sp. B209b/85]MBO9170345.1 membrane protein FxsA [Rhizobium sp. L245/93]MBO9186302.1 membrane protein FxsA [Rhizobium sp. E27B/91]MBZ5760592.1 membrane protein FxsA [Rhizobium sp. VS19-DR96]
MRLSLLPAFVLLLPLVEIAGFVVVGKAIGIWATLGLVVLSVVVGAFLLRSQGLSILRRLSMASRDGAAPARDLVHGAMVVVAAFLLLVPGFFTDILGLLLFIPGVRDLAWKFLSRRIVILGSSPAFNRSRGAPEKPNSSGPVVDLDADDFRRGPNPGSPWSDHKRLKD